jgi:hypothetical protein
MGDLPHNSNDIAEFVFIVTGSRLRARPPLPVEITRSEATRFGCLTPRLKSSANLNGWNARMTFKHLKASNARAG